jgi:hypothetical protein
VLGGIHNKMRKLLIGWTTLLTLTLILAVIVACGEHRPGRQIQGSDDLTWSIVKSPITDRCYEVATQQGTDGSYGGFGYMGMAEIPCEDER